MPAAVECIDVSTLRLAEYPKPAVAEDGVLLKVLRAGVCGTDLEGIKGRRNLRHPVIPGHEVVAVVEKIGSQAHRHIRVFDTPALREGDRVTINPRIVCGRCHNCQHLPGRQEMCLQPQTYGSSLGSGQPPYFLGGWAEHLYVLPGSELIKLPDGLSDDVAVLCEPFGVAAALVDRFQSRHDWIAGDGFGLHRTVLVYGAGAIGILMAAAFALAGAKQIIMVDVVGERLALSESFGVTHTMNSAVAPVQPEAVKEMTEGLGADIVVEACGVPQVIGEGIQLLRRGGTLFEVGHLANVGMAEIDPLIVCRNELEILGHYAYPTSQSLAFAARLLAAGDFPYERLLHTIPLREYAAILDDDFRKKTARIAFRM